MLIAKSVVTSKSWRFIRLGADRIQLTKTGFWDSFYKIALGNEIRLSMGKALDEDNREDNRQLDLGRLPSPVVAR